MLPLLASLALAGVPEPGPRGTFARPTLAGTVATLDSADGFFRIHYAVDGADAVSLRDEDTSGVPDYVERVLAAMELGRETYAEQGWRPVVRDLGEGGSTALDVYLTGVDINGYAYALEGQAAEGGYACFIEIDPQLATAGLILESVAVHELHHCVEYRYGATASWLHEGSATAEQYSLVSDLGLQLAVNVLWDVRLSQPELPVADRTGRYEYAAFSFFKYWSDQVADRQAVWEAVAANPDGTWLEQLDAASTQAGLEGFDEAFLAYQAAMAFACGLDDGEHWVDDGLRCTSLATPPIDALEPGAQGLVSTHGDAPYTTTVHELPADGQTETLEVTCSASVGEIAVALAAIDVEGIATDEVRALGDRATLARPVDPDGAFRIVITSLRDEPAQATCVLARIEPSQVDVPEDESDGPKGCGCAHTGRTAWLTLLVPLAWRRRRS
ncbi:MAG: hypothetical protein EP330_30650 [Deltaproteobacteria bacterium]|nr:MAG: hypothetical protein EP330_30650 [Deltaproteobacteria bacterium]